MSMRRILFIEGNPVTQSLVGTVLKSSGHEVIEAANGEEGERLLQQSVFDLVISADGMQDGLTTIRAIRRRNARVPILAMSGHPHDLERHSYLNMTLVFGANDIMPKPLDPELLKRKVSNLLSARAC
jgi:DNA-binding response OmpR family regulator